MSVYRILILAIAGVGGLLAKVAGTPEISFRQVYSLNPTGTVEIQNAYGDVRVVAWDRSEVLVEAVKNSAVPEQTKDAEIVVSSSPGLLSIRTQYPGDMTRELTRVEYRIMVPRKVSLQNVKLTNGELSLHGLRGTVQASSVNGAIRAEHLGGCAELSTVNGWVEAEFERVAGCGGISLSSINGPIRLSIPREASATVSAQNVAGGIDSNIGQFWRAAGANYLLAVLNRGCVQIHLRNVNGGISIRTSWSHFPKRRSS